MNKCPYCGSTDSQGVSGAHGSFNDAWDFEQLNQCLNSKCHKHFVTVYVFSHNITMEESTVFEDNKE